MNPSLPSEAAPNRSHKLLQALCAGAMFSSLLALPVAVAQGLDLSGPVPSGLDSDAATSLPGLEPYLADLRTALALGGPGSAAAARDVAEASQRLALARSGLSAIGTFTPGVEYEHDLGTGDGDWDVDVDLDLAGAFRYDRERILRAEIALERAAARLRAQRRTELERALLALSNSRLSARAVESARSAVEETAAALAALEESDPRAVAGARIAAEMAIVDLERELLEHLDPDSALTALGLSVDLSNGVVAGFSSDVQAWIPAVLAPRLRFEDGHDQMAAPQLRLLSLELELAEHLLAMAPFEIAREVELYGGYEAGAFDVGARLALERGVPTTEASVGWSAGASDHAFSVGVGATFRLSEASSDETRVAERDVEDARVALASHLASWPLAERHERTFAELAHREFVLDLSGLELSIGALEELEATGSEDRATQSARNAVRRARDASERAWQRYVRALGDYLDVVDVVLRLE